MQPRTNREFTHRSSRLTRPGPLTPPRRRENRPTRLSWSSSSSAHWHAADGSWTHAGDGPQAPTGDTLDQGDAWRGRWCGVTGSGGARKRRVQKSWEAWNARERELESQAGPAPPDKDGDARPSAATPPPPGPEDTCPQPSGAPPPPPATPGSPSPRAFMRPQRTVPQAWTRRRRTRAASSSATGVQPALGRAARHIRWRSWGMS
jgi:hypothetical protein